MMDTQEFDEIRDTAIIKTMIKRELPLSKGLNNDYEFCRNLLLHDGRYFCHLSDDLKRDANMMICALYNRCNIPMIKNIATFYYPTYFIHSNPKKYILGYDDKIMYGDDDTAVITAYYHMLRSNCRDRQSDIYMPGYDDIIMYGHDDNIDVVTAYYHMLIRNRCDGHNLIMENLFEPFSDRINLLLEYAETPESKLMALYAHTLVSALYKTPTNTIFIFV